MTSLRFVALFCAVSAACSSGGGSSITESQYGNELGAALCAKALQCCATQSGNPTQAECVNFYGQLAQQQLDEESATGHVSFSSSNASSCTSAISSGDCLELFAGPLPASCNAVFTGSQANGGACQFGVECQSTLCLNETGATTTQPTPGTCAAQGAAGQACAAPASLGTWLENQEFSGSLCAADSYPSVLVTGTGSTAPPCTCIALTSTGSACPTAGSQGCASGYCDQTAGVCAAPSQSTTLSAQECTAFFDPD